MCYHRVKNPNALLDLELKAQGDSSVVDLCDESSS